MFEGFDCANPYIWVDNKFPTDFYETHMNVAPQTPNSILEFQGGAFDPWGGPGYEACAVLLNHEFERVFYKNKISFSTTIFNIYMAGPPIFSYRKKKRKLIPRSLDFRRY